MNPTNENPTPIDCASPQPSGYYQPPQVLLELTLECQAGSALLPDLVGEMDAVP